MCTPTATLAFSRGPGAFTQTVTISALMLLVAKASANDVNVSRHLTGTGFEKFIQPRAQSSSCPPSEVNATLGTQQYNCAGQGLTIDMLLSATPAFVPLTIHISLSNNNITYIPSTLFRNLTMLLSLIIQNNFVTEIQVNAFVDLEQLQFLNLAHNPIASFDMPSPFSSLSQLKTLFLIGSNLKSFADVFDGLINLESLSLFLSNSLTLLEGDEFSELTSLNNLSFSGVQITQYPSNLFQNLNSLDKLSFENNVGVTALPVLHLPGGYASFFPVNITNINLNNNALSVILFGAFGGLTQLQYLSLHLNQITLIVAGAFDDVVSLETVYLNDNLIFSVSPVLFAQSPNLRHLDLYAAGLYSLPGTLLRSQTALEILSLGGNSITCLCGHPFQTLTALQQLDLEQNKLMEVSAMMFNGLSALQYLDLSDNLITQLVTGVFSGLHSLTFLDLESNSITSFPSGAFDGLSLLTTLQLSGNVLICLDDGESLIAPSCPSCVTPYIYSDTDDNPECLLDLSIDFHQYIPASTFAGEFAAQVTWHNRTQWAIGHTYMILYGNTCLLTFWGPSVILETDGPQNGSHAFRLEIFAFGSHVLQDQPLHCQQI